jgi:hypothetical protein
MAHGVLHRQQAAPRVAEHRDRVEPELAPHAVDVLDLRGDGDLARLAPRSPAAALVVIDEANGVREPVELWEQVGVVEFGPAVEDDHRRAVADRAAVEVGRTFGHIESVARS